MAILKSNAIVMERSDYRETSYLLRLLTAEYGLIRCQAKGARRSMAKFGTTFMPLSLNTVLFYEHAHTDLHIISQADLLEPFSQLSDSLDRYACAFYFSELVNTTLAVAEPNRQVYDLLLDCLYLLQTDRPVQSLVQIFEIKFLSLSGLKPRLNGCVHCSAGLSERIFFSCRLGGLLCAQCILQDRDAFPVLKGSVASINHIEDTPVSRIANFTMLPRIHRETGRILRNFIDYHLERKFNSLQFWEKLRVPRIFE